MPKKLISGEKMLVLLLMFTIILSPWTGLNIMAFLALALYLAHKIFKEYAVLLLLLVRPAVDHWRDLTIFSYQGFSLNINAALAILLLVWAAWFLFKNSEQLKFVPYKWWWLAFCGWSTLSLIWSFDKGATVVETVKALDLLAIFAVSFVLYKKYQEKYGQWLHYALFASAVIPIALAIYQFFTQTGLDIDGIQNRIYGTFAHPNILATFALLIFMAIADKYLVHLRNRPIFQMLFSWMNKIFIQRKYLLIAFAILLALIIAFTYTRIAWVGLVLFLLVIGLIFRPKLLAEGAVAVGVFYLLFHPVNNFLKNEFNVNLQNNPLMARLTARNPEADSIQWRADVANKVTPLYLARPIVGYGYGAFARVWDESKPIKNIWDNTSEAHNDYLKIIFETGVIGLILFLGFFAHILYSQIKYGHKHGWANIVFISSVLVYLALSVSDNMLHHTPVIWWMWTMWGYWSAINT